MTAFLRKTVMLVASSFLCLSQEQTHAMARPLHDTRRGHTARGDPVSDSESSDSESRSRSRGRNNEAATPGAGRSPSTSPAVYRYRTAPGVRHGERPWPKSRSPGVLRYHRDIAAEEWRLATEQAPAAAVVPREVAGTDEYNQIPDHDVQNRTIRVIVRKLDHPRGRGLFNGDYVLVGEFPEDITVATLRGHIATYAGREAQDVYLVDKGGDRHVVVGPTKDGRVTELFYGYRYDDVVGRGNRRGSDGDDDLRRREPPVYMIQLPPGELGTHDGMRRARGQRLRGRW